MTSQAPSPLPREPLVPMSFLVPESLESIPSNKPYTVLFDSGSTSTWITCRCLPPDFTPRDTPRTSLLPMDENGEPSFSEHVNVLREDQLRFKLKIDGDQLDDLISYNQLMEYLGDHTDSAPLKDGLYRFKCITDHNLLIKWETGEQTWETLCNIIAVYAKKHDLLNTPGWKLSKITTSGRKLLI